ncbi:MAG: peroxiredoxin family protein [Candidatus Cryptobacteroides sp.]|nr:TlpA disulfide reductase family protein [Bacteroidales bacterium]
MKKLIIAVLLSVMQLTAFAQLPSVTVEDINGNRVNTKSIADGKTPAVILFWAVTCKPCIQELDAINEALDEWKDVADFRVIAISTDDTRFLAKAKALTEGHGWDGFTLLFDKNSDFKRAMNVVHTPQAFIVGPDGKIVYSHTGYNPGSEEKLLEELKKF